jgi:hypothetical protein
VVVQYYQNESACYSPAFQLKIACFRSTSTVAAFAVGPAVVVLYFLLVPRLVMTKTFPVKKAAGEVSRILYYRRGNADSSLDCMVLGEFQAFDVQLAMQRKDYFLLYS